jgi:endonuclease I
MKSFIIVALLLILSSPTFAACTKQPHDVADLNSYYSSAAGRTGPKLKAALNRIIRGHTRYSYTPCVWKILQEADEDPNNSNNVIEIYTGRSIPKSRRDRGRNDPNSWNREHIWAKSHGFPKQKQHAYTDAHHLRAADRSVNSDRSNNDFDKGGEPDDECIRCREGVGTWEPPDRVKGDIARMLFYMATRYEGNDGSNTPDLELVNRKTRNGEPFFGKLCTLVTWHNTDKVDDSERRRNNIVQSWQGNRNPYIDHPEYVAAIWGKECGTPTNITKA